MDDKDMIKAIKMLTEIASNLSKTMDLILEENRFLKLRVENLEKKDINYGKTIAYNTKGYL